MLHFIYSMFKYVFILLFSITLLTLAAWNIPQTRDSVITVKDKIEERFDIDIDKYCSEFVRYYDVLRGSRRGGFK